MVYYWIYRIYNDPTWSTNSWYEWIWKDQTKCLDIYIYIWYDHVWKWTIRLTAHVHQMLLGQQMGRLPISSGTQEIRKWIQVTRLNYPDQMTSNYYPLTKQCCDGPSQCWTMLNMFDLLLCMADFHLQNAPKNSLHGTRPSLCWTLRTQRLEFAHNTAE